ncbi:hypothetical protein ES332_D02G093800v1 [Gossypium tomentosum]|uniref:Uncharacterized protein n=1 Tax=Gossypium tomentosum TaxID=34277 RepID=A0A5D2LV25_GOSTO|nr:hypothetical protein ES332_D02G093800v1 [Gossypium tomentosum]
MHSPYSAGPPPNGRLAARNAITARFGYGAITSIGCNSHFPREAAIMDSALVSYFLFHSLPSSTFRSIDSPTLFFQR